MEPCFSPCARYDLMNGVIRTFKEQVVTLSLSHRVDHSDKGHGESQGQNLDQLPFPGSDTGRKKGK